MRLVAEFERIVGVREVLLHLFFNFSVGFNPVKKLRALTHVCNQLLEGILGELAGQVAAQQDRASRSC